MYVRGNPVDDTGGCRAHAHTSPPHTQLGGFLPKKNNIAKRFGFFDNPPDSCVVLTWCVSVVGGGGDRTHDDRWLCTPVARARRRCGYIKRRYSTAFGVGAPSLFCAGGVRERVGEEHERQRTKSNHPRAHCWGNRRTPTRRPDTKVETL